MLTKLQIDSFVWRSKQQALAALLLGDRTTNDLRYKLSGLPSDSQEQFGQLIAQDKATRTKVRQVLSTGGDSLSPNQMKAVAMSISSTAKLVRLYASTSGETTLGQFYSDSVKNLQHEISAISNEAAGGTLKLLWATSPVLLLAAAGLAVVIFVRGKLV